MSAAHLEMTWALDDVDTISIRISPAAERPAARHGGAARPVRCPECHSIVYSRRHRLCGVCSQPLPDHLLFSMIEARRVEDTLRSEQNRHRQWMERRCQEDALS